MTCSDANLDAVMAALPGCVAPGAVPRYPPIISGDTICSRLMATYDHMREAAGT